MKSKVRYIMKIEQDEQGFISPEYGTKTIENNYIKKYSEGIAACMALSACPYNLIDYLASIMDQKNIVHINKVTRKNFIHEILKLSNGKINYHDNSVKNAVVELQKAELLVPVQRGVYQVNPMAYFRGKNESVRLQMIKENLEKGLTLNFIPDQ